MLATLLITRQFLQNVREVSQPHLYRRLRRGDLSLRDLRQLAHAVLHLLAPRRRPPTPTEGSRGEKKCLNGGCGVPEEEEEEEERRESDSEEESALDCGLKLKKVSFIERAERRGGEPGGPEDESFLEEGSPTMVEKGMDPASVFELCEDEEEAEGPPGSPAKVVEPAVVPRAGRRRRGAENREEEEGEEEGRRRNRASWIDPPEEDYSTQLTQAEVESCMKKYEVSGPALAGSGVAPPPAPSPAATCSSSSSSSPGHLPGLPGDVHPVRLRGALLLRLPAGRHVRPGQQRHRDPQRRLQAVHGAPASLRPAGREHRPVAGGLGGAAGVRRGRAGAGWPTGSTPALSLPQKVMEAVGVLAIVVNCYLIAQCGQLQRLFPWLSPEGAIISVVVLEVRGSRPGLAPRCPPRRRLLL